MGRRLPLPLLGRMRVPLEHVFCVSAIKPRKGVRIRVFVGVALRFEMLWFCEGKLESFVRKGWGSAVLRESHFSANFSG